MLTHGFIWLHTWSNLLMLKHPVFFLPFVIRSVRSSSIKLGWWSGFLREGKRCQSYPGIKMHALETSKKVGPVGWCRAPQKITAIYCFLIQKCNLSVVLDQEKVFVCVFHISCWDCQNGGIKSCFFFGTCWCLLSRKSNVTEALPVERICYIWRAFLTSKNLTKDGERELVLLESWTWRATTMNVLRCGYRFNISVAKKTA